MEDVSSQLRRTALGLLSRREHSRFELRQKLEQRYGKHAPIDAVLDELVADGYQSDQRVAEMLLRAKSQRGYGPVFIANTLRQARIDSDIIDAVLEEHADLWQQKAIEARQKKFGRSSVKEPAAKAKVMRFLQYRGFTSAQIRAALDQ